jgi:hypothetical protein
MHSMIRYLEHPEIDKTKWDECISHSVNGIIYAQSWYLDIVSPGWNALVGDDYVSLFPLTHGRKFGFSYLFQPYFTQQLGLFTRNHLTENLVHEFLDSIPVKYRFAEIHLNSFNKIDTSVYDASPRINLELDMINNYENLRRNYDQNVKRNLKKAFESSVTVERKVEPDELITLFRENYGRKEKELKFRHYEVLRKLMVFCQKKRIGVILGARLPDGRLCAAGFFLFDRSRIIFHFAASDSGARESGAMFLLIDSFIREHAGQALTLDFEGSNDPNVARFYKSFGAVECNYFKVTIDRLPWIAQKAVYLRKRFR